MEAPQPQEFDARQYPVMVVDDEEAIVQTLRLNYRRDFNIVGTTNPQEALTTIGQEPIAVLIADQRMPEMTGTELIRQALEIRPGLIPIILTGYTDVEALAKAINIGRVYRYLPKPWDRDELRETILGAVELHHLIRQNTTLAAENGRLLVDLERANDRLRQENRFLREQTSTGGFGGIIGNSPALQRVIDRARKAAASPTTTVLIGGPTGSGKELFARAIHEVSPRAGRLFVAVNAGTMTETLLASTLFGHRRGAFTGATADQKGLFEIAHGGTLFLDEIGETTPSLQVHLLRVLQEGEIQPLGAPRPVKVDVRVIAATNRDLDVEVTAGRFREDLLHRLRVFPLRLPPLAERREDIPALTQHVLARHCRKLGRPLADIDADALAALQQHPFRGNVRELENMIERALLLCEPGLPISIDDLFDDLPGPPGPGDDAAPTPEATANPYGTRPLQADVLRFEAERLRSVLTECDGNKSEAARRLGMTRNGLLKKLARCGVG